MNGGGAMMSRSVLNQKIHTFINRKHNEFPDLDSDIDDLLTELETDERLAHKW